jgi:hypothetical protein
MNERIKRLYAGAVISVHDSFTERMLNPSPVDLKFAQLIVAECLEQVWHSREDGINGNISEVIKERMKQHFGVEE